LKQKHEKQRKNDLLYRNVSQLTNRFADMDQGFQIYQLFHAPLLTGMIWGTLNCSELNVQIEVP